MFQLRWHASASSLILQAMASVDAAARGKLLAALADIEQLLAEQPTTAGESRSPGTRIVVTPLLTIAFHPNVRLREVFVSGVKVRPPKT